VNTKLGFKGEGRELNSFSEEEDELYPEDVEVSLLELELVDVEVELRSGQAES
jgi:hypothetical protein